MILRNEDDYLDMAQGHIQKNKLIKAMDVLNEGLLHFNFSIDLHLRKAELLLQMDRPADALETLDIASLIAPQESDIKLLQIEAFHESEQYGEALSIINELKSLSFEDSIGLSDLYQLEATIFMSMEEEELGISSLKSAIYTSPSNDVAHELLWLFVEEHKRYEDSISWYEDILEKNPFSHLAWYNFGQACSYIGQYTKAIEHFKYSYTLQEDFEQAYHDCAELCFELQYYKDALEIYLEILETFDIDEDILMRVGVCYFHFKKYNTAIIFFSRALQYDPLNDEAFFEKGNCFASQEKWESAVRSYKKAINIADEREDYFAALANAYFHIGEYEKAESQYLNAIQIAPELSHYWIRYALLLAETGKGSHALDVLEEAEIFTYDSELLYGRIVCLFVLGRRQEGRYRLSEALIKDFQAHKIIFELYPDLEYDSEILSLISNFTT